MVCSPLPICVRVCVRLLAGALEGDHGCPLLIPCAVKVNFRGAPVLMPENTLDAAYGNTILFHGRRARMSDGMETEVPNSGFFTKRPHELLPVIERPIHFLACLSAGVGMPEYPGLGLVAFSVSESPWSGRKRVSEVAAVRGRAKHPACIVILGAFFSFNGL